MVTGSAIRHTAMAMTLLRAGKTDINTAAPADLKLMSEQLTDLAKATSPKVTITMYNDLPVVAYAAAAVPETVGDAGVLLTRKRPALVAAAANRVVTDKVLRQQLQALQ